MVKGNVPALHLDPETHRALQLDALAAILPIGRRDRLAELLTDDDIETLKHLAREAMGEDSLRVLASDLAYLEARPRAAAALAGDRGVGVEIRGASSAGSVEARERSPTWDARGRRRKPAGGGLAVL
jgi:hypothetical protein